MPPYPNRYSSYGGGGNFTLSFPPFRGAVRALVLINVAVFFLMLFGNIAAPGFQHLIFAVFGLIPGMVTHGWVWQLVTYGFLHAGIGHIFSNMLMLWMFGSTLEGSWGRDRFLQFYLFCVVAAALTTIGVGWVGLLAVKSQAVSPFWDALGFLWQTPTVGASGGVYGVLIAFGMIFGDQEVFLFPLPFRIKAKYMIAWPGADRAGFGFAAGSRRRGQLRSSRRLVFRLAVYEVWTDPQFDRRFFAALLRPAQCLLSLEAAPGGAQV